MQFKQRNFPLFSELVKQNSEVTEQQLTYDQWERCSQRDQTIEVAGFVLPPKLQAKAAGYVIQNTRSNDPYARNEPPILLMKPDSKGNQRVFDIVSSRYNRFGNIGEVPDVVESMGVEISKEISYMPSVCILKLDTEIEAHDNQFGKSGKILIGAELIIPAKISSTDVAMSAIMSMSMLVCSNGLRVSYEGYKWVIRHLGRSDPDLQSFVRSVLDGLETSRDFIEQAQTMMLPDSRVNMLMPNTLTAYSDIMRSPKMLEPVTRLRKPSNVWELQMNTTRIAKNFEFVSQNQARNQSGLRRRYESENRAGNILQRFSKIDKLEQPFEASEHLRAAADYWENGLYDEGRTIASFGHEMMKQSEIVV